MHPSLAGRVGAPRVAVLALGLSLVVHLATAQSLYTEQIPSDTELVSVNLHNMLAVTKTN